MMTRGTILVAGKSGQLARSIAASARNVPDLSIHLAGRPGLDITSQPSCQMAIDNLRPDLVINTAAFTDVDRAESSPEEARHINSDGARNLAQAAAAHSIPVLHISTDYVFDGSKQTAYVEWDTPNPVNTYGLSKLDGEQAVMEANPQHLILRTAWLYSPFGASFISKILKAAAGATELSIVDDQIGNPTSTLDLARVLLELSRQLLAKDWGKISGVYHLASAVSMSRYALAEQVMAASRSCSGPACEIRTANTAQFPTPAPRPLRTALDTTRTLTTFGLDFPPPEQSLTKVVGALLSRGNGTL